jgi:hypothetical protein
MKSKDSCYQTSATTLTRNNKNLGIYNIHEKGEKKGKVGFTIQEKDFHCVSSKVYKN